MGGLRSAPRGRAKWSFLARGRFRRIAAVCFAALLGLGATSPANGLSVTPFGTSGEGGSVNGQTFTIGAGGEVFELDGFVNIPGQDLNGATYGTSAQLSVDSLPGGLAFTFSSTLLDSNTDIILTYEFTNNTGGAISGLTFVSFVDAEIDKTVNTSFNEVATTSGTLATGQDFEVDEPGWVSGDIFSNALDGALDGTNALPPGSPDDVSVAQALSFGTAPLQVGGVVAFEIMISEDADAIGSFRITQSDTDPSSSTTITYSGLAIPEPGTASLIGLGLAALATGRSHTRRRGPPTH